MNVVRVRVDVRQGFVAMAAGMRSLGQLLGRVLVLVVLVVLVNVRVLERVVGMGVLMNIGRQ